MGDAGPSSRRRLGSHMRKESEGDYAEAFVLAMFLSTFALSFARSNETLDISWSNEKHVDIRHATFAAVSKSRCQLMRLAFSRRGRRQDDRRLVGGFDFGYSLRAPLLRSPHPLPASRSWR